MTIKAKPTIPMVILRAKGQIPKNIKAAPVKANKIPNINKTLFIVIIFLLSNYPDLYSILSKNRLIGDFLNFISWHPRFSTMVSKGIWGLFGVFHQRVLVEVFLS